MDDAAVVVGIVVAEVVVVFAMTGVGLFDGVLPEFPPMAEPAPPSTTSPMTAPTTFCFFVNRPGFLTDTE